MENIMKQIERSKIEAERIALMLVEPETVEELPASATEPVFFDQPSAIDLIQAVAEKFNAPMIIAAAWLTNCADDIANFE